MSHQAFTLLELLIVMTIIGILTAVAYPSYSSHLLKARRTEAKMNLIMLTAELEKYYVIHHNYEMPTNLTKQSDFYFYQIDLNKENYKITATPEGAQKADNCGILSINNLGQHFATGEECW